MSCGCNKGMGRVGKARLIKNDAKRAGKYPCRFLVGKKSHNTLAAAERTAKAQAKTRKAPVRVTVRCQGVTPQVYRCTSRACKLAHGRG